MHGLAASLVNLVVAAVYSLLVVRLSLDYLGKQEYGLLSLIAQISAYIAILDLGLTIAFGRILIDYTGGTQERYANALKTASLVFNILGIVGFIVAAFVAFFGTEAFSIPPNLNPVFTQLMLAQGGLLFATFSLKALSSPLIANGRHYIIYWVGSAAFILNGLVFWFCLHHGLGIFSSTVGQTVAMLLNAALMWKLSAPFRICEAVRARFDPAIFKEVVSFSKDTIIWQIGGQTMGSLPILLASVWFALNATADLAAGLKLMLLALSVCTRFGDMSVTPLSIEYSRGNELTAARQMTRIAGIAGGIGVCAALFTSCSNPSFLHWWMLGKVSWSWHANLSAAVWIAVLTVTQCLYGYAVISRQLKLIRWALLAECILYVGIAAIARYQGGPSALLWAKPIATLAIGIYVALKLRKHTNFDTSKLLPTIIRQSIVLAILLAIGIPLSLHVSALVDTPVLAFAANSFLSGILVLIALPFLFTGEMRDDILGIARTFLYKIRQILSVSKFIRSQQ